VLAEPAPDLPAPRRVSLPDGGVAVAVEVALNAQGRRLGRLELLVDAGPWLSAWRQAMTTMIVMGATGVFCVALAAWALAGALGRNLRALAETMDDEAVGRRDPARQPLDNGRRDELGKLQQSLDALLRTLRRRE
jgi:HAMP domain-containing protein